MATFPTSPTTGQQFTVGTITFTYNGTAWVSSTSAAQLGLDSLSDVTISSVANSDILQYELSSTQWKNKVFTPTVPWRNRIINGDMRVSQMYEGTSVASNVAATNQYLVDMFTTYGSIAATFSSGRNLHGASTVDGFNYYLGVTSLSAATLAATTGTYIAQSIEGYNCQDMLFGMAAAKTLTLSFWFYTTITGTYAVALNNNALNRSYVANFSGTASTWVKITLTIPGDTAGTWDTSTAKGLTISWNLGTGTTYRTSTLGAWQAGYFASSTTATNIITSNAAQIRITGVQLEIGSTVSDFEYIAYSEQVSRCQRYFFNIRSATTSTDLHVGTGLVSSTNTVGFVPIQYPVPMAKNPVFSFTGDVRGSDTGVSDTVLSGLTVQSSDSNRALLRAVFPSALTANNPIFILTKNTGGNMGHIMFNAYL